MLSVLIQIQIHQALIQMFQFQPLKDERDAWSPDQTNIKQVAEEEVYQVGFVILNKFRKNFWILLLVILWQFLVDFMRLPETEMLKIESWHNLCQDK